MSSNNNNTKGQQQKQQQQRQQLIRQAKKLASLLIDEDTTATKTKVFEVVDESIKQSPPHNLILRSPELEKYLPTKDYSHIYLFVDGEYKASYMLSK